MRFKLYKNSELPNLLIGYEWTGEFRKPKLNEFYSESYTRFFSSKGEAELYQCKKLINKKVHIIKKSANFVQQRISEISPDGRNIG